MIRQGEETNIQAYMDEIDAKKEAAKRPTAREQELMDSYGIDHEQAKKVDGLVAETHGISGAILADYEQFQEEFSEKEISSLTDDELKKTYARIVEVLGGLERLSSSISPERTESSMTLTNIHFSTELEIDRFFISSDNDKAKMAAVIRSEAFIEKDDDPGYESLKLVALNTDPHHDQYLERSWSDSIEMYQQINPEVFKLFTELRAQILNEAFKRSVGELGGMPINDEFLDKIEDRYGDKKAETTYDSYTLIYPQIKGALIAYKKALEVSQSEKVDVSHENFDDLYPILLGVDTERNQLYYGRHNKVPLGRQWLEVSSDHLTLKDIAIEVQKLYKEKFVNFRPRYDENELDNPDVWSNSWVDPETAQEIILHGFSAFLEKNIEGFSTLNEPFKKAITNIFTSIATEDAQNAIHQWNNSQDDKFDYSSLPSVGDCVSLFPPTEEGFKGSELREIFYEIRGSYEDLRVEDQPHAINLSRKKPSFNFYKTCQAIQEHRSHHQSIKDIFNGSVIAAMVREFELNREQTID